MNPKIGKLAENEYPTETVSGKSYIHAETDPPPAIVHDLGLGYVAIGDVFPPVNFDIEAELDKLRAEIMPKTPTTSETSGVSKKKADSES